MIARVNHVSFLAVAGKVKTTAENRVRALNLVEFDKEVP